MADVTTEADIQDRIEQALLHPETISPDELKAWLGDENFREQYSLAKDAEAALLAMHSDVDAAEAFSRFKAAQTVKPRRNMRIVWGVVAAIAACLLCVWFLRPTNMPQTKPATQHLAKEQVYAATPSADNVTITTDGKTEAVAKAGSSIPGITITPSGDIICQRITKDGASNVTSTITVPHGKIVRITLPDGTRAWLNAQSSITYPQYFPEDGTREVSVEGEAYLEVTHDARRPFVVMAGDTKTTVLGTTFNIRNYNGSPVEVTLVSGKVNVSRGSNNVMLHPGQMTEGNALKVSDVYTDDITCWKDGRFAFSEQTLQDVMVEIGRWYNLSVIFADRTHALDRVHFSGERSWEVSEILSQIDAVSGTNSTVKGNTIIVK